MLLVKRSGQGFNKWQLSKRAQNYIIQFTSNVDIITCDHHHMWLTGGWFLHILLIKMGVFSRAKINNFLN